MRGQYDRWLELVLWIISSFEARHKMFGIKYVDSQSRKGLKGTVANLTIHSKIRLIFCLCFFLVNGLLDSVSLTEVNLVMDWS